MRRRVNAARRAAPLPRRRADERAARQLLPAFVEPPRVRRSAANRRARR
ncbi:hypothetical protein BURPS668_1556 [Burkholderia pseudomallei 668]|nr:hypothetical protein BURPS668_1556 [Burkholderia pseudomallei 668]